MTQGAGGSWGWLPDVSQPLPGNMLCLRDRKGHPGPAHLSRAKDGGRLQLLLIILLAGMDDQCDVAGVVRGKLAEGTNDVVLGSKPAMAVRTGSVAGTAQCGGAARCCQVQPHSKKHPGLWAHSPCGSWAHAGKGMGLDSHRR